MKNNLQLVPSFTPLLVIMMLAFACVHAEGAAEAAVAAPAVESLAPLPPADTFTTVLSNALSDDDSHAPTNPGLDLLSTARELWVTLTEKSDFEFNFATQVVADQVPGVEKGTVVTSGDGISSLRPDHKVEQFPLTYPEKGLLPGLYRLEILQADEPRRLAQSIPFKTHFVTLPPPEKLNLVLRQGKAHHDRDADAPIATEFSSWPEQIFAELTAPENTSLDFFVQVISEDVAGIAPQLVIGSSAHPENLITPENRMAYAELSFPRMGLPPGRYRVEAIETAAPHRLLKTTTFTTHDTEIDVPEFNLADSEFGALLESVTGEEGAGYSWAPLLLTRNNTETWTPLAPPILDLPGAQPAGSMPCDLVISFFQREAALVSAVELTSQAWDKNLPRDVEIWGSTQSVSEGFTRLATTTIEPAPDVNRNRIEFPATSVRFLKVRIVSKQDPAEPLQLTGLKIVEGHAPGYQPLAKRLPAVANWRMQPRHAAQRGLYFLQPTAALWQQTNQCLGCHVQSQSLVGINVARTNDYVVSGAVEKFLTDFTFNLQAKGGNIARNSSQVATTAGDGESSNTVYGALGMTYAPHAAPANSEQVTRAAHWLAGVQSEEGSVTADDGRAPIEQGEIMFIGNCLEVWAEALRIHDDPALRQSLARGLNFIVQAETVTTQDETFKIMSLIRYGDDTQKKIARQLCSQLLLQQQSDGGWKLDPEETGTSTAFTTGQVLYAFRLAGINPNSASFQRGVQYLIRKQNPDGSWKDDVLNSRFAATMWPVIALAGSFGSKIEPAHVTVTASLRPRPAMPLPVKVVVAPPPVPTPVPPPTEAKTLPRNIEFILDCSLSMDDRLGKSTRIETAKQVMRDMIGRLPSDANVGLRLYGHRFDSMSAQSAKDTELMVPITPIDRAALLKVVNGAVAHGQTPLVYSTLKAGDDLKSLGGGTIIVVTDGEESCGGKPRKAGQQLVALGVPLRLDIIGFTLTGKRVVEDLTAFTGATGGRFYTAADGLALSKALAEAITPVPHPFIPAAPAPSLAPVVAPTPAEPVMEDFAYEIFNSNAEKVVNSRTQAADTAELAPGLYRVVLHDGGKEIVLPQLKIEASETIALRYDQGTGQIQIQQ